MLIDPCEDEPSDHFSYDISGKVTPLNKSAMGKKSIEVFNLSEPRLERARMVRIGEVTEAINLFLKATEGKDAKMIISKVCEVFGKSNSLYAGAVRYIEKDPARFGYNL